ncbi:MAG: proline--tRNA ligase [Actinobacteria bacterium]|nr:proline--tRNA ligase [Actinomycetota bacterium]
MRMSRLFAPTLREAPAEAEVASHRLLVRAGLARQLMAGVYTMLPLGLRTLRKIEAIVRDEMDAAGAQELRMPIVVPSEPWKATGRWEAYGDLMFKLVDRRERELGLGPTHEEVITPLAAADLPSYRDLPVNLYQVGWKYRDELRPRFGLIRGREFLMKDAYSFDRDEEGMRQSYRAMYEAYRRVFDRCGLEYVVVEADPGQIGGGVNHEYMALAEVGEDLFVRCENDDYLADVEAATPAAPPTAEGPGVAALEEVHTPGAATIDAVSSLLGRPPSRMLKCMLYAAGEADVAVLVPGDREVNEEKLARLYFPVPVSPFGEADFARRDLPPGYVGPQGLPADVTVLADPSVRAGRDWVAGANRPDHHVTGAKQGRDFRVDRFEELVRIREGDRCPNDGGELSIGRSIVVGHIYQLGTRYSEPLGATFADEDGTARPYRMGSYGIGISRIVAAAVEQHHDEAGIAWPRALAPYEAVVVPTNMDVPRVVAAAERIHGELTGAGVEAVLDDREVSAGVKFADADLIGFPVQVTVGRRGIEEGVADLKVRATGERFRAPLEGAARAARDLLAAAP